jgi:hypothetical protein
MQKEILIPENEPIKAWRLFSVGVDEEGKVRLFPTAASAHVGRKAWEKNEVASCWHPSPAASCRCGLYGVTEDLQEPISPSAYLKAGGTYGLLYGEVALTGRAFVDWRSVRAERAEILQIITPTKILIPDFELGEPEKALAENYGVPVSGMQMAPEWVVENYEGTYPTPWNPDRELPTWTNDLSV